MEISQRYVLVGTSHVSKESKQKITKTFAEFKPDIIALELDRQRYQALSSNEKSKLGITAIGKIGITGYLFAVIGRMVQKKIGNLAGMNPGEEMLLGANLAKNNKLLLALIDQDVAITLKNLSKQIKFTEKLKIGGDIFLSPLITLFSKKNRIKIDISKIPPNEVISYILKEMKGRYPGFYKVLLEDRNRHMAKKIYTMLKQNPGKKIMAVVGAGHLEGIKYHMNSLESSNVY